MYRDYGYSDAANNQSHGYLLRGIEQGLSGLGSNARVLDIGCGNGSLTAAWAKPGWDVAGVDPSESGIARARSSYPNIAFHQYAIGPELINALGKESFDAIVTAEVIEHLYAPRDLVSSSFALLKPGGVLIVTTPYNGYLKNLVLSALDKMDKHWTVLWDGGHIKFWSWKTLQALLREAGFVKPEFLGVGRAPYLWKSMVVRAWKPARQSSAA